MSLSNQLLSIAKQACSNVFSQKRSQVRAADLIVGLLCAIGRRTISRCICALGHQNQGWCADYKLYSRSPWETHGLFDPIFKEYAKRYPQGPVVIALDDTRLSKTGRKIGSAFWQRDPLSPPFHINLMYGLRFIQASLIFPHYQEGDYSPRAFPVRFTECPAAKKPGKKACEEEIRSYRQALRDHRLPVQGLEVIKELRICLDRLGQGGRRILLALDGSLCNRTIFKAKLNRVDLVARCRKDARLCFPAPPGTRRKYGIERFSPEAIRKDDSVSWENANIHFGGMRRSIRYKEVKGVLWQGGAGTRKLRLLVVAPQPYRLTRKSKLNYRQPAYLLSTDVESSTVTVLQAYFDRWQIEVNHREEKDTPGVGQAQVRSAQAVPRHPAFAVASYSLLLLAGLQSFGPGRPDNFMALPKWRKSARRASALDLITLLRMEINERRFSDPLRAKIAQNIVPFAYA
jgi:hypothetical protein